MQVPSIGRHVLFYPHEYVTGGFQFGMSFIARKPHAAIITYVHSSRLVNVVAFDTNGKSHGFTSVAIEDEPAEGQEHPHTHARWPVYVPPVKV